MKKFLASVGIGNASVDTVLEESTVRPGDTIDAEVHVTGGESEQTVEYIELEVETQYLTEEHGYEDVTIDRLTLTDGFTITPGEEDVYETTIDVPYATPLSMGDAEVWVETDLEIPLAVDPDDADRLEVGPTPRMQAVFDAAEALGLSFYTADCEADPYGRYVSGRRFVQEFEFRARGGQFAGDLDELDLVFEPTPEALTVFVEVDRRGGLLTELADADERTTKFTLAAAEQGTAREKLERAIRERV